ncbi:hypothetical protein VK92_15275 [Burkholderia sp. LK4]|nr:hypothetical protein VL00_05645 [Burkholderia cepacia]KMN59543.1 hypothetical protein VK92_15275 [Burkholderia sp. LK4]
MNSIFYAISEKNRINIAGFLRSGKHLVQFPSTVRVLRVKFCTRLHEKACFIFEFVVYCICQELVTLKLDDLTVGAMLHQHVEKLTGSRRGCDFVNKIIQG